MAAADFIPAETETREVVIEAEQYSLHLNRAEAYAVLTVAGKVGGNTDLRHNLADVYDALSATGIDFHDDENDENRDSFPIVITSPSAVRDAENRASKVRDLERQVRDLTARVERFRQQSAGYGNITVALRDQGILDLIVSGRKIYAIKRLRRLTGCSLYEAKNTVEFGEVVDAANGRGRTSTSDGYLNYLASHAQESGYLAEWEWELMHG